MNALRSFDRVSIDFARKKLKVVLPEEGSLQNRRPSRSADAPTGGDA